MDTKIRIKWCFAVLIFGLALTCSAASIANHPAASAARSAAPIVAALHPDPVIGSPSPQVLTLEGIGFVSGSVVKLHDRTHARDFALGSAVIRGGTRLLTSASVADRAADWSLEVVNPDGRKSRSYAFRVLPNVASAGQSAVRQFTSGVYGDARARPALQRVNYIVDGPSAASTQASQGSPPALPAPSALPYPSKAAQGPGGAETSAKFTDRQPLPGEPTPKEWPAEDESQAVDPPKQFPAPASRSLSDQTVRPEMTTAVIVSSRDVNRIACQDSVQDAFWSQERPVKVSVSGSNVFVKFMARKFGEKLSYANGPVDLHVVCGDAIYTMVLHPQPMDSVTVRLAAAVTKAAKKLTKDWAALPLEDKIQRFTLMLYKNDLAEGFERQPIPDGDLRLQKRLRSPTSNDAIPGVLISAMYQVIANGTGLKATEYSVVPDEAREFRETDFLSRQFGEVVGVTLDPLRVDAGQPARLIVVSRSVEHGT